MRKVIIVTGAASGIGRYIVDAYSKIDDYEVICIDNNPINNIKCESFKVDLKDENATNYIFEQIERVDLAINCAGVPSTRKQMVEFSKTEIVECWQENFIPTFNAMKNEINIMIKQGSGKIINVASITGHIGMKNFLAYGAAKAAIINMTKVAAIEQSNNNIKINSISPATIDTPMIREKYNGVLKDYSNVYYTKNCGTVEDVFAVVKMLENNNFMTGQDIKIDGGMTDLFEI